jgi:hypothetical protein
VANSVLLSAFGSARLPSSFGFRSIQLGRSLALPFLSFTQFRKVYNGAVLPRNYVTQVQIAAPTQRSASLSLLASQSMDKLSRRERELARSNALRYLAGIAIVAGVLCIFTWATPRLAWFRMHFLDPIESESTGKVIPLRPLLLIEAGLCLMTFVLAILTRKESRADMVDEFIRTGSRSNGSKDDPVVRWALMLFLLGLLQGEFLLIDAMKLSWLRLRLASVDRSRAAMILARLLKEPAGLEPHALMLPGETTDQFRKTIAYLMACEWGDISARGDHFMLLSPAKRALRG